MVASVSRNDPETLTPAPYALHPTPSTSNPHPSISKPQSLNLRPQSSHPQPCGFVEWRAWMVVGASRNDPQTLNPAPYTPHPSTPNPKPQSPNPKPQTLNPNLQTSHSRPSTLHPMVLLSMVPEWWQRESSLLTTYWSGSTDVFGVPASRHGSLNPLFQAALYIPSYEWWQEYHGSIGSRETLVARLPVRPPKRLRAFSSVWDLQFSGFRVFKNVVKVI